jgi:CheY-like chemotaxis protein
LRVNTAVAESVDLVVVEDDADILSLMVFVFEQHGLTVRTASNGRDAYALIQRVHPRLVLSDLMMPVMRGDDLYEALHQNKDTSTIPFIMMTAVPGAAPQSIDVIVPKPIDLVALEDLVLARLSDADGKQTR